MENDPARRSGWPPHQVAVQWSSECERETFDCDVNCVRRRATSVRNSSISTPDVGIVCDGSHFLARMPRMQNHIIKPQPATGSRDTKDDIMFLLDLNEPSGLVSDLKHTQQNAPT